MKAQRGATAVARDGVATAAAARPTRAPVTALYERLPRGPHGLGREHVARHQRARIHGAMVEAVARRGYRGTSVSEVTALAGVSRRTFYEHFANREACFLATFDQIARRGIRLVTRAYVHADGERAQRLGAALAELARLAAEDRKATSLVASESRAAGKRGALRLKETLASFERLLRMSLHEGRCRGEGAPPSGRRLPGEPPRALLMAAVGGLHGSLARALREPAEANAGDLTAELMRWALPFAGAPTYTRRGPAPRPRAVGTVARAGAAAGAGARRAQPGRSRVEQRERLKSSVLREACAVDYSCLTVAQVADAAGVPVEGFFASFPDLDACFLAGLEAIGARLESIAAGGGENDWPQAVRLALAELLAHLARNPLHALTITRTAFAAGGAAAERNLAIALTTARLLTAGAPGHEREPVPPEAIAGAIWHVVESHVAAGHADRLPALADQLAFAVLAPFIGADAAAAALWEGS